MAKLQSDEWIAAYRKRAGALPNRPGKNAIILNVVGDGRDGEVRYFQVVEYGSTTEFALGAELNPNVASMRGRVKAKGNVANMMALLPLSMSAEHKAKGVRDGRAHRVLSPIHRYPEKS